MYLTDYFDGAFFIDENHTPYDFGTMGRIAFAAADMLSPAQDEKDIALIARDTSANSETVYCEFIAATLASGIDVMPMDILPAPALSWAVADNSAQMGVFISSERDLKNSVKIRFYNQDGSAYAERQLKEIEKRVQNARFKPEFKYSKQAGRLISLADESERYINSIVKSVNINLNGLSVALDCANGAILYTAKTAFERMGARCVIMGGAPSGYNTEKNCGADKAEFLRDFVLENLCDIGFAFDNSGLRCVASDETGNYADGSTLAAVYAQYISDNNEAGSCSVLLSESTNFGIIKYLMGKNIKVKTFSDDDNTQKLAEAENADIIADKIGYMRFSDKNGICDALYTAAQICKIIKHTGKTLSDLTQDIDSFIPIELSTKVPGEAIAKYENDRVIQAALRHARTELGENGCIRLSSSQMHSTITVIAQSDDYELINNLSLQISKTIKDRYIK